VLPAISNADNECTHALSEWIECSADNADALIVAQAKSRGIFHILSDDLDFATMSGITLYSANQAVVNSARIAGKLVSTSCGSVHIKR
jgi:predicted nucleic-acid-binding protein